MQALKFFQFNRSRAVAIVSVLAIAGIASPTPAYAGPNCSIAGCSSTYNDTGATATALFNWCTSSGSTGDATTTRPSCSSDGVAQKQYLLLGHEHTPENQDWDVLQIDAGWCYKVYFDSITNFTRTYDRRGKTTEWVKIADYADAHIQGQSNTTCP
ncbi:hypothetical protein [Streptomyces fuscichromogenes]|uniref:Secreted protein n=1 Tax=Streptomyces fuscichromogenes TaxID=1324013 RepID=A0A918CUK9_9ACTN|nr:hypothetical protein [Streptomyces fuscichromogenes]GGN29785.1 hypothetical protein GCM10011578_066410 [Streptomyces fuscichromogenes]